MTVVDNAAVVQVNAAKTAKTFGEYSKVEIGDKVHSLLTCMQQLYIVLDVYQKGSRKKETREGRGKKDSVSPSINENTPTYRIAKALKTDDNKTGLFNLTADTQLFNLMADTQSGLFRNQQKVLLITRQETVLSNRAVDLQRLQPC